VAPGAGVGGDADQPSPPWGTATAAGTCCSTSDRSTRSRTPHDGSRHRQRYAVASQQGSRSSRIASRQLA
jgi:hypothetical protein